MLKFGNRGPVEGGVNTIVSIFVAAVVASHLVPLAINEIEAVDTSGWAASTAQLWDIMSVMIVVALLVYFAGASLRE